MAVQGWEIPVEGCLFQRKVGNGQEGMGHSGVEIFIPTEAQTCEDSIMTPHDIEVLLHHHCSNQPWPRQGASAYEETISDFISWGVMKAFPEDQPKPHMTFNTTQLGCAWVKALCNVPMPRMVFLDGQGKEITP